jgi:NADH-quinone oxidoreductase subunit N
MLIVIGIVTVACGFYYYFKVVRAMYWETSSEDGAVPISGISRLAMTAMIVAIVFFGIFPGPIVNALRP